MKSEPNNRPLSDAEEIEAMLPWLVAGTLSRADAARVTRYLETHPEAAAHVALAREERDAAISSNEMIGVPSPANLDRLMASVANTPRTRSLSVPSPASVWEKVAGYISGFSPKAIGFAAAAAALILVAQAATIGLLMKRDAGGGYQTASGGPATVTDGVQALVVLQPGVTSGTFTGALMELRASVIDGPKAGGIYRLRIAAEKADAASAIAKAKARSDVFSFVGPAQ